MARITAIPHDQWRLATLNRFQWDLLSFLPPSAARVPRALLLPPHARLILIKLFPKSPFDLRRVASPPSNRKWPVQGVSVVVLHYKMDLFINFEKMKPSL